MQPNDNEPRASASVILLDAQRGGKEPFGVYLLRRSATSKFMPERFVFPGGAVDPGDGEDPLDTLSLKRAAIRELWEEAGVVLAAGAPGVSAQALGKGRACLLEGRENLDRAMQGLGLEPDLECLLPYSRWITPAARSRRFDTTFFLATMPKGQEASSDEQETSQGLWLGPAAALESNQQGRVELAPPQIAILGHLSQCAGLDELLAAASSSLDTVRPVLWSQNGVRVVLYPWDPDHPKGRPADADNLGQPCPAHLASRVVMQKGRWLPYRLD